MPTFSCNNLVKSMDVILVACETIEDEVKKALERIGFDCPVIWLEGGLHNSPERLRVRLQEVFSRADGQCRRLLVSLGFCGGGVSGLTTGDYETVLPLADDCLSLLLGSMEARKRASRPPTYFLTSGWMRHENNVVSSYQYAVERYGQKQADRINHLMLKNYSRFGLVATGCYDLDEAAARIDPLAVKMNMTVENIDGDMVWLTRLLTGPYDDPNLFLVMPPRSQLTFDDWCPLIMGADSSAVKETPPLADVSFPDAFI
ncbi:MAG: DUF1638 domain-containing protein [Deltaproteobacteria bacterium]|nr:DUF1638 domain-containing protein [Deltaproteobacteria bacterium]